MSSPGVGLEGSNYQNQPKIECKILKVDSHVLERIIFYLKSPGIHKGRTIHLNGQSGRHETYESDPQDLYHTLLTCKAIFKPYENILQKQKLLELFYLQIAKPPHHESRLIEMEVPEKFRKFVAKEEMQHHAGSVLQDSVGIEFISQSMGSLSLGQSYKVENSTSDDLVDLLSQNCVKRAETFGFKNEKDQSEVDILRDLKNQFLGIINFYQYDTTQDYFVNGGKAGGHRPKEFWAMICHCKKDRFLVLHSVGGKVWDRNFACPRVAEVTSKYAHARNTYEAALTTGH
ncbi:uncharacterized protein LAJ45_10561 [Morchella importuna]|uniref:uncharacterized protein n=1 Tax=Morchella importuna TaxID=1174673 RepID=UPI001E8DC897|nr:uncharacterized protein LAJ45_10561 [Morchella importuna]KAH8145439.1 hypothetical protein LAJ45_10561 [Morchella importuna]